MRIAAWAALAVVLAAPHQVLAEPAVSVLPSFPTYISKLRAAENGAYLLDGSNRVWFVDDRGAREVPTPIGGRIEDIELEPGTDLLWGCSRDEVFATNASGVWVSWPLPDDPARRDCHLAPSPGTTWLVTSSASADGPTTLIAAITSFDATIVSHPTPIVTVSDIATDGAGGLWAYSSQPQTALSHFDGASWRLWTYYREAWLATGLFDVFAVPRPFWSELLVPDGTGGVVAASSQQLVFMRSTAPIPVVDYVPVKTPGFGLGNGVLGAGPGRVWGLGRTDDGLVLASWDLAGRLASAEEVEVPPWFSPRELWNLTSVSASHDAVWVAIGETLFRRDGDGFQFWVQTDALARVRRERQADMDSVLTAVGLGAGGVVLTVAAPAVYAADLGVEYPRALLETALGFGIGAIAHWVTVSSDPWDWSLRTPISLTVGLLLNGGIAVVATVTPETLFVEDTEPFPIGGAVLGAAVGFTTGALVDLLLHSVGVESRVGRALLWSAFTAVGAPLGFHALRGPLGAE